MESTFNSIIDKILEHNNISFQDILYILENTNSDRLTYIINKAYSIRKKHYGNSVYVRGLIEFSNICKNSCKYCGLRCSSGVKRYRLLPADIIKRCFHAYSFGYRTFVLQSGEDPWYTESILVDLIKSIKSGCPDAAVTLSIGERSDSEYEAFRFAGADRFLLRHESINKELYESLHPDMSYENRIRCLNTLKMQGYQTGAGFMVGVKGQSLHNIAQDIVFLHKFMPHMIGIGPFLPAADTPFENEVNGDRDLTLLCIALIRILVPNALIPLTTALVSLDQSVYKKGLTAGANVIMPNITPQEKGNEYKLYNNKHYVEGLNLKTMNKLRNKMKNMGYQLDMGRGDPALTS